MNMKEELDFLERLCVEDAARAAVGALDASDADVLLGDGLELLLIDPLEEHAAALPTNEANMSENEANRNGGDHSLLFDAIADPVPAKPSQQRCGVVPKRTTYVNRTKQELEYLRREIVGLEKQLTRAKSSPAAPFDAAVDGQRHSTASLWERLANRQKEERRKAEIENEKLREMLDGQLRIARSLEKVLRKRTASNTLLDSASTNMMKRRRPEASDSSDNIFAMLSDDLDDVYASFDAVMRQTGLKSLREEVNDAQAMLDASGDLYMELRHAAVVPFSTQHTGDAMWRFLSMTQQEIPNGYMTATDCTHDTIRMKVYVTLRLRRSEAVVCVHLLVRRIIEEHRVLFVSSSYGVSEGSLFDGEAIKLRESNWTAIESASGDTDGDESASIVKTCLRMMPSIAGASSKKSHLEVMIDLVITSYAQNMKAFTRTIENLLLDKSLGD